MKTVSASKFCLAVVYFFNKVNYLLVLIGKFLQGIKDRPMKGNPNSGIQETFSRGIRNPGNIFSWNPGNICSCNPESTKHLLGESEIQETFARGIRNPRNIYSWNSESRNYLLVESAILLFEIRNPGLGIWNSGKQTFWNLESTEMES